MNNTLNNTIEKYQSKYPQGQITLVGLAILSLVLFISLKLSIPTQLNRFPEFIYTLCFLVAIVSSKWVFKYNRSIIFILLGLFIPYILLGLNVLIGTQSAYDNFSATQLVKLTFFMVMGFWLGGNLNSIYLFLFLSALGLVASIFQSDFVSEFSKIINGNRVDFDLHNAQHTSMFFGLLLIGVLSQVNRVASFDKKNILSWGLFLSLLCVGLLAVLIIIGAQTRGAWLAFLVVLAVYFVSLIFKLNVKVLSISLFLLLITAVLIFRFSDVLQERVSKEIGVVSVFLEKGLESVPYSSIGTRLHTWDVALDKIAEHPFIGFGAKARKGVIRDSIKLPDHIKNTYGHFHNSYIEFTLAYGLIGLGFLLYLFIWTNYRMYQLTKKDGRYQSIWYFTFYGTIFMAVINVFESFVFFWSGIYAMSVLLAPAYSLHLADVYKNKVSDQ